MIEKATPSNPTTVVPGMKTTSTISRINPISRSDIMTIHMSMANGLGVKDH
jgi:hypothetical protein